MSDLRFEVMGSVPVDYEIALQRQRELHAQVVAGDTPDTVLLLQHTSVYTAGKRTASYERPTDGTPVIDVDRGGRITWHGPGQLVGYPIVRLTRPMDVVAYVRRLEQALIDAGTDMGLHCVRVSDRSGVWLPADGAHAQQPRRVRKVAAIGARVARGVTMHGFALNCNCDLSNFARIVPCGIEDADVTSLSAELERNVSVPMILPLVARHLADANLPG